MADVSAPSPPWLQMPSASYTHALAPCPRQALHGDSKLSESCICPQAVEAIWLLVECPLASWLLPTLRLFPNLRLVGLFGEESDIMVPLEVPILCDLPCLEVLRVEWWESAHFTQPFTALTSLDLFKVRTASCSWRSDTRRAWLGTSVWHCWHSRSCATRPQL